MGAKSVSQTRWIVNGCTLDKVMPSLWSMILDHILGPHRAIARTRASHARDGSKCDLGTLSYFLPDYSVS